jgi:hypothetical protein
MKEPMQCQSTRKSRPAKEKLVLEIHDDNEWREAA